MGGGEGAGSEATPSETEDHVQLGGGTGGESHPTDNNSTDKNNSQYGRSHPPLSGNIRNRTTPSNAPIPDGHPCHRHAVVPALSVDLALSSLELGASAVPDGPELLLPATPFDASNGGHGGRSGSDARRDDGEGRASMLEIMRQMTQGLTLPSPFSPDTGHLRQQQLQQPYA